ncbi:MAG: hypothetical protein ACLFTH_04335 [Candidatus Woesearchaeota archaeon]
MADHSYFVRIPDYELIKLALLESAKESLLSSKAYHELLEIRKEKEDAIKKLKTEATAMMELFEKLVSVLPHSEEMLQSSPEPSPAKKSSPSKKTSSKKSSSSKHDAELDRLNKALSDIERKLEHLS